MDIQLKSDESREALWERFFSFMEGNLLVPSGKVKHMEAKIEDAEVFSPTLLNTLVVLWLHAIHPSLPALARQRFSTDLKRPDNL